MLGDENDPRRIGGWGYEESVMVKEKKTKMKNQDKMLKIGPRLYVHEDEIACVSFRATEGLEGEEWIDLYLQGNPEPFELWSKEARDDLMSWLMKGGRNDLGRISG